MAKFELELPESLIKDFQKINSNAQEIFEGMTRAGAEIVMGNVQNNLPDQLKTSNIVDNLKMTRSYKTPSDDGINTKVAFYGYFTNRDGKEVPAPLIANLFEYGRSDSPFPKQPFLRKSFRKGEIEKAMLKAQRELSGGLLK